MILVLPVCPIFLYYLKQPKNVAVIDFIVYIDLFFLDQNKKIMPRNFFTYFFL